MKDVLVYCNMMMALTSSKVYSPLHNPQTRVYMLLFSCDAVSVVCLFFFFLQRLWSEA